MGMEKDVYTAINLFYEAVLNDSLWARALTRLGDSMGSGQIALTALDRRAMKFDSIAPRTDPIMETNFQNYWAFRNPVLPLAVQRPTGEIFSIEGLLPRQELCGTRFFHEWYRPANFQIAMLGANLRAENEISTLLFASNLPGKEEITTEQAHIFKTVVRHVNRAIYFHRELRLRDLDQDTAPVRLEGLNRGVMLVDGTSRLLFANAMARQFLGSGCGLAVKAGCLHSTEGSNVIQRLIASCAQKDLTSTAPGGKMSICLGPHQSWRILVTPLRAKGTVSELPWLGLLIPVAIVTISNVSTESSLN
ncbi:MAG: hypothetical protein FWC84_08305 [Alphaproteobacteria bacterium]|nr:hypothetical protein [Alphaproteobacteria bacterium]